MIIDTIDNLERYEALYPLIADVVAFMRDHDLESLDAGTHPVKGEVAYVNIQRAKGKAESQAAIEYHRRMVDIQMPIEHDERYGYTPLADLPPATFDEENDFALLTGIRPQTVFTVKKGQFVLFTPQDGHAPCISDKKEFKKAVFKIKA